MTDAVAAPAPSLDISSEQYREYTYADGTKFKIDGPTELFVTNTGSHRVVDRFGITHRPEKGYVGISWKAREGQPKFVA